MRLTAQAFIRCGGTHDSPRTVRGLSALVLMGALILLLRGELLLGLASPGQCSYLRQTGRPCLGCGGTRAYGLAATGQLSAAARMNLLGAFSGAAVWLVALGSAASLVSGHACFLKLCVLLVVVVAPLVLVGGVVIWWRASSQYVL